MPARRHTIASVWDAFTGAASELGHAVGGDASKVYEWFSDAGQTIGSVLKFIAPIVALWPGIGTALSVALSAAAAYACGDAIEDAIVDIASNAIPGGVPRAIFRGAADVSRDAIAGRPVGRSIVGAARGVAGAAGGERAVAAFDVGWTAAQGENIGDDSVALARNQFGQSGTAALAAFDGGVAIARGGNGADAVIAAARAYIGGAGGPGALAAFDMGFALARGKDLQDAGFAALKALAQGNDAAERAVHFGEAMLRAAEEGRDVKDVLLDELGAAFAKYGDVGRAQLGNILKQWAPDFGSWGSQDLADYFDVAEVIARAAQAIMRDGKPDEPLREELTKGTMARAVEKYGAGVVASRAVNRTYAEEKATLHSEELETALRISPLALSYGRAKAEQAPPAPIPQGSPAPAIVAAPSGGSRSSVGQDVLLGLTIAGAIGALYWWSTHAAKV